MGRFDFRRCDGFAGSIPQRFIDTNLPRCPMCGSDAPYWKLKDKMELASSRTMFRCGKCGCILSATTADIAGISKSPIGLLTTAGAANALLKRGSGKQVNVTYLRVEEVGSAQTTQLYRRRELPLEELQALAGSL